MQNMNYDYDFSGQKSGYPLRPGINGFSRSVFSRQSSLEILASLLTGSDIAVKARRAGPYLLKLQHITLNLPKYMQPAGHSSQAP